MFQVKIEGLQNAFLLCRGCFMGPEDQFIPLDRSLKISSSCRNFMKKWKFFEKKVQINFSNIIFEKIRNFKCLNCEKSRSFWSVFYQKPVSQSVDHKLSFETLFGAKFKILKWRILIGRKFFEFFFRNFFFKNIKKDWLSLISL